MTTVEAERLVQGLISHYGKPERGEDFAQSWVDSLEYLKLEVGEHAVGRTIDTWQWKGWPTLGFMNQIATGYSPEGLPNADAYGELTKAEVTRDTVEYNLKLHSMGELEYWGYINRYRKGNREI